jgi:Domain of unknown function DUF1828
MQMNLDCSRIQSIVHSLDLVNSCDVFANGTLRICTPFSYPNGDRVDVFLKQTASLFDSYQLSDFGQTAIYLRTAQVAVAGTARKREVIEDIISQLGVQFEYGDLFLQLSPDELTANLPEGILRLSQACVRISDFATHQRLRSSNPFRDDVEEFLESQKFMYTEDVKVKGAFGKDLRMDFEVRSGRKLSYVNILAAMNDASAHASAVEIFTRWHDLVLTGSTMGHNLVTIYNSASKAIRAEDILRLKTHTNVVSYPEEQDFLASILREESSKSVSVELLI